MESVLIIFYYLTKYTMFLLWLLIIVAPVVFMVRYKVKQQTRQFVLAICAYLLFVIAYFGYDWLATDQIKKAENIISDFQYCVDQAEDFDDLVVCHTLLDSDITLYEREYK